MKKSKGYLVVFVAALLLWNTGRFSNAAASHGEFLYYRPQPQSSRYDLSITTRSQALALFGPGPQEEHQDIFGLSQKVERVGDGLLDIALTVDEINLKEQGPQEGELYLTPRGGSAYKRKETTGNTGHTLVNLQGVVKEVKGIPHFGSTYFHPENLGGPPLNIYSVMSMLYPQFPMRFLKEGDSWKVKDEVTIESAEAIPLRGLGTLKHELSLTVKKDIEYRLIGFGQRGKYETAHIEFSGVFSLEGEMITEAGGDYIEGRGKSSGEVYFAPGEGLLVEVTLTSEMNEQKSKDGNVVHWFNSEESMATFLAQRTAAITWLTNQTVHFVLADTDDG